MGIRFLWDSAVLGALSMVATSRLKIIPSMQLKDALQVTYFQVWMC